MWYRTNTAPWRPVSSRNARIPAANRGRYPLRTTEWRPSAAAPKHKHNSALSAHGSRSGRSPEVENLVGAEPELTMPTLG
jgi:hypothetical protein